MEYHISFENPLTHYVNIRLVIKNIASETTDLHLPTWRPGRYEAANYARNIQQLKAVTPKGEKVPIKKVSSSKWQVKTKGLNTIEVHYNYYAGQLDAGSSWLDEDQLYLNFINCLIYIREHMSKPCQVKLRLPAQYQIACGLKSDRHLLQAKSYYQLVDSPMIASASMEHLTYVIENTTFHLWVMGENSLIWNSLIASFSAFSKTQAETMGGVPFDEYHFLYQITHDKKYHGVEHGRSTVIALGPGQEMDSQKMRESLLGVSSHELFHAWNVIRIRPKELMPYDFNKEVFFPTGCVAEGVTTYYGDLFLARSRVFDKQQYFKELNTLCDRHFENYGRFNHSLVQSSYDLWLDGYDKGIPNRKVSIYTKGALAAFILDLHFRKLTDHQRSLDDLMRLLWEQYGQTGIGYTLENYMENAELIAEQPMKNYFDQCIFGTTPLEQPFRELLPEIGCELAILPNEDRYKGAFGFSTAVKSGGVTVAAIAPGSPAESSLSLQDQIMSINGVQAEKDLNPLIGEANIQIDLIRQGKKITVTLTAEKNYFPQVRIKQNPEASEQQKTRFEKWLGCNW